MIKKHALGRQSEASGEPKCSQMALFGLPKCTLGTLKKGLGKQDAPKGGSKGKKLHFAPYIVLNIGGGRAGENHRNPDRTRALKRPKHESK